MTPKPATPLPFESDSDRVQRLLAERAELVAALRLLLNPPHKHSQGAAHFFNAQREAADNARALLRRIEGE